MWTSQQNLFPQVNKLVEGDTGTKGMVMLQVVGIAGDTVMQEEMVGATCSTEEDMLTPVVIT